MYNRLLAIVVSFRLCRHGRRFNLDEDRTVLGIFHKIPFGPHFREVRLLLGVIAYNLGNLLRRLVSPVVIQSWSLTSLRQRPFKTGGRLIRHARYSILQLAEGP